MKILVTAGNTQVPLDRVRCITNIFTGRTGTLLALCAQARGHDVTLLTSHPDVVEKLQEDQRLEQRWHVHVFQTFDDLRELLQQQLTTEQPDAVLHSAAVSDYQYGGIFAPDATAVFDTEQQRWHSSDPAGPRLVSMTAGKVKSDAPELWLRLVRTPKLVDMMRRDWSFAGVLVKFKLEVGISEKELLDIAERSRQQSSADLMVANTLEGTKSWAYMGPIDGEYQRIDRRDLAQKVIMEVEKIFGKKSNV